MSRRVVQVTVVAAHPIRVAAQLCAVHPQTLRTYERHGLLEPGRTPSGARRYSDEDIALLRRIAELARIGMSLDGIAVVLELEAELRRLRDENAKLRSRS